MNELIERMLDIIEKHYYSWQIGGCLCGVDTNDSRHEHAAHLMVLLSEAKSS